MSIIRLDSDTIEKIAAGEVIESPFSVVKELVENSIDANSKNISIEIKNGGKTFIRVTDDGDGINKDDLRLAFEKHATSKISKFDDLYRTLSLGFRGEALPSIAAVSKVIAISKPEDQDIASKLEISQNSYIQKSIASNKGTSIIVEDLFYNIPARRKFLKSDFSEANKITKLLYSYAICYNNISFKYIKDDRVQFQSYANRNLEANISDLLDNILEENLIPIRNDNGIYKIKGFIAKSNYYRGNRSMEYIFINNRLIENTDISKTIEYQYQGLIPNNRYPAFFVFIQTDPKNLDINIHPNKKIIKFSYEDQLLDLISDTVRDKLKSYSEIKIIKQENNENDKNLDFSDYRSILEKYSPSNNLINESKSTYNEREDDYSFFDTKNDIGSIIKDNKKEWDNNNVETFVNDNFIEDINIPKYMTSIFSRYSIFEDSDKLYLLDHRRASETIIISEYMKKFSNNLVDRQTLIDPIIVNLRANDLEKYLNKKDLFEKMGFLIDQLSDNKLIVREVPLLFDRPENKDYFYSILDIEKTNDRDLLYKQIRKLAKAKAFRKGHKIDKDEAITLYKKLMQEENPYNTYDGKATIIMMEEKDLEKYFER